MESEDPCMELAIEGERVCKNGDFAAGVTFLEAAIRVGTDDLKTLSAIYSQLGNAYFYLGDYEKAMDYHRCDLTVARAIGDEIGEGKASGNLGNTLKVVGRFDEAVACCEKHLTISRKLGDRVGEGRALYNLANVYHSKGKTTACPEQDPGEFSDEVKASLKKAVHYYDKSLKIMVLLDDKLAQGRACGNLGNTHYLLANFRYAIYFHNERLRIAKECFDMHAERRAHNNLGNAHVFLGEFRTAADHYMRTLHLALELKDKAVEAQSYYSLGNTYTLMHDYPSAIEYHKRHLRIAQDLNDRIGEGRACWSLGNAYSAIGAPQRALEFANLHLDIARELGDESAEVNAKQCIKDIKKAIKSEDPSSSQKHLSVESDGRRRRISMEQMDLVHLTPKGKVAVIQVLEEQKKKKLIPESEISPHHSVAVAGPSCRSSSVIVQEDSPAVSDNDDMDSTDGESFFDLLSRFQSERMDDQRCALETAEDKENNAEYANCMDKYTPSLNNLQALASYSNADATIEDMEDNVHEELFDLIAGMQSRRLDEQRASLPRLPGLNFCPDTTLNNHNNNNTIPPGQGLHRPSTDASVMPDDEFFEMLMRCQGSRIEDQRSTMPENTSNSQHTMFSMAHCNGSNSHGAPTVPDENFFGLIMRLQAGRIEDQRSALPVKPPSKKENAGSSAPSTSGHSSRDGNSSKTSSLRSSLKSAKGSLKR